MKPVLHDELFIMIFILIIIIPSFLHLACSAGANHDATIIPCHENEKQALLRFKNSTHGESELSSWKAEVDCCSWERVVCNNITGHVVELDLSDSRLVGVLDDDLLLNLTHLTYLDLSWNDFSGAIPSVANFTEHLQYFDISFNNFTSTIPDWIYECKYLERLDALENSLQGSISNSIANLTSLYFLELSFNSLSGEIPSGISTLCLKFLRLSYNEFGGDISNAFGNMSNCFLQSLEILDLNNNQLSGNLTYMFGEFNLEQNKFPSDSGKLSAIEVLDLGANRLSGNLPESMGQLFNLRGFDVSNNMLVGIVTETHFANLTNLYDFRASGNHLTLKVSDNWTPSFNLTVLNLGSWDLGGKGRIPEWIHNQKSRIDSLDLSNTGITYDQVPSWLWQIHGSLNLSHNKLSGNIHDHVILTSFVIDLSSNLFNGSLPKFNESNESIVSAINLSNNSFTGGLHDFLCNTPTKIIYLVYLNLERNMLSGELPDCWMKFPWLNVLHLGNNNFSGHIPESIGKLGHLQSLNLFNNILFGQIPSSIMNCTDLWNIDLSNNMFSGKIPAGFGTNLPGLNILILRSNKLLGDISSGVCGLNNLRILDLSDNKFSGILPSCLGNMTSMADSAWVFPVHNDPLSNLDLQESATVATKGTRLYYDTVLALVTNIDLSSNIFSGDIPKQLMRLAGLRSLNLSRNHLNGEIPDGIEEMKVLESLDLSNNFLSGRVPHAIADVPSLSYLDLSYNNLSGEIPQGTQISTFNASSFVGNKLCGPPLISSCSNGEIPTGSIPRGHEKDDDGDGESEFEWMYVFVSLGYAVGVAMVLNILVFKKSWRESFFVKVDNMLNKISVHARKNRNRRG